MPESTEQTIEILLIDDHTLFREGVVRLLKTELVFKVIACGSIKEALAVLRQQERQVLSYVFEGLGNKEIAARIGVSESSVKASLQQLFSKTGVHTRGQLVRIALEQYRNYL